MSGGVEARFAGARGTFRLEAALTLEPGAITALSGPSGAGKTTLLRCLAGLTWLPGEVTVGDEVWQDDRRFVPTHRRAVGVVFQETSLLPHLSVRGNLLYGARRAGAEAALGETAELLGLEQLLDRGPANLSGGERQRVALARALLTRPRLLLMDEPLSSLDAEAKAEILPYLDRLHRTLAIPALYVTHDAGEIARLADRVLLMRDGRVGRDPAPGRGDRVLAALWASERDALARAAKNGMAPKA